MELDLSFLDIDFENSGEAPDSAEDTLFSDLQLEEEKPQAPADEDAIWSDPFFRQFLTEEKATRSDPAPASGDLFPEASREQVTGDPSEEEENEPEKKEKREKKENPQRSVLIYLHDLVYLLCGIMLVFLLLFRVVVVSGDSMKNTLIDGDYLLLLSNIFYRDPQQGDIIVASKDSFRDGEPIVKRVVATEGQVVDIDFTEGVVYVDGKALDEPYTSSPTTTQEGISFPLTVEEGCVFVMGDNRSISMDSRSTEIGLIDKREILGKAIFLFLPGTDKGHSPRYFYRIGVIA